MTIFINLYIYTEILLDGQIFSYVTLPLLKLFTKKINVARGIKVNLSSKQYLNWLNAKLLLFNYCDIAIFAIFKNPIRSYYLNSKALLSIGTSFKIFTYVA